MEPESEACARAVSSKLIFFSTDGHSGLLQSVRCRHGPFPIESSSQPSQKDAGVCGDDHVFRRADAKWHDPPTAASLTTGHPEGMADESNRSFLVFDEADEYHPEPPPPPEIPAWKNGGIRIGIHTSIAGNISGALEIAHGLGANAVQIFSSSPRMWTRGLSRVAESDASRFRQRRKELGLGPLVIHDNYLINLASADPVLRTRSVQAFHQELVRAISLGADYLVAHPGCCGSDRSMDQAIASIAQGLRQAARGLKLGDLKLLLENTAGQGTSVGSRFEELQGIIDACPGLPLGVCVDTAHLFAAGWDLRTAQGLEAALNDIGRSVGLHRVAVVHMNDSKTLLGSRVDRHEHIGKGKIGLEAFERILKHPQLAGCSFILETPIDKPGDDRRNVAVLWKLVARGGVAITRNRVKLAPGGAIDSGSKSAIDPVVTSPVKSTSKLLTSGKRASPRATKSSSKRRGK